MIIDAHVHVPSTRFVPRAFLEGSMQNAVAALLAQGPVTRSQRARVLDLYTAQMQDHQADGLVRAMDGAGVAASVLLLPDFTYVLRDSELTYEEMVQEHAAVVRRHPNRLTYLCGPDPRWGTDGVRLFERAVESLGCSGLKLYPPCGYSPSSDLLDPYYEICASRGLPVLIHTGPTSPSLSFEWSRPGHVDGAARRFPGVNFVLAHAAVFHVDEACDLAAYRPNVFVDCSGYAGSTSGSPRREVLRQFFKRPISHKILFGTDWPVHMMQCPYAELIRDLDADEVRAPLRSVDEGPIRGANARRIFPGLRGVEAVPRPAPGSPRTGVTAPSDGNGEGGHSREQRTAAESPE